MKICEVINYGADVVFSNQKALKQQKFTKCEKYLGVALFALCSVVTVSAYFFYQYFQHKKIEHIQKEELKKELVVSKVDQAFKENKIANKNSEIKVVIQEEPVIKKTVEHLKELVEEPHKEKKEKENPVEQAKELFQPMDKPIKAVKKDPSATKQVLESMYNPPKDNKLNVMQQELLNELFEAQNKEIIYKRMEPKATIIDIRVPDGSIQSFGKGHFRDENIQFGQFVKFNDNFFNLYKDTPFRPDDTFEVVAIEDDALKAKHVLLTVKLMNDRIFSQNLLHFNQRKIEIGQKIKFNTHSFKALLNDLKQVDENVAPEQEFEIIKIEVDDKALDKYEPV